MSPVYRVGVLACSKAKLPHDAPAEDLYQGELFRLSRRVVVATCERYCILSAKYGVILPTERIAPYDETLNTMLYGVRRAWARKAHATLRELFGPEAHFVVYAGSHYRTALQGLDFEAPLAGLGIGRQLQALRQQVREIEAVRSVNEQDLDCGDRDGVDALDDAIDNCYQRGDGDCLAAGSEYCDWECPFRDG